VNIRLPEGASASDRRKTALAEGRPPVVLAGRVVFGSVKIKGPRRRSLLRGRGRS
jgi:hypothetical protein